ncbi:MAG: CHAT domain-containing protein [Cyclobacteriaceae bacterium]
MISKYCSFLALLCLLAPYFPSSAQDEPTALRAYREADRLFQLAEPTAATDSLSLAAFLKVTAELPLNEKNAPLVLDAYKKAGILRQTYGAQQEAVRLYVQALEVGQVYELAPRLLFEPSLYLGNAHYFLNNIDSSILYLKKAEQLLEGPEEETPEAERLYNSFGAIYFEEGNYRQSINYFSKAIALAEARNALSSDALYSFKSNIASALLNLHQYDSAVAIYHEILPFAPDRNEVYLNLGTTYLKSQLADSALQYLQKVKTSNRQQQLIRHNKLGEAYLQLKQYDEAEKELQQALQLAATDSVAAGLEMLLGATYHKLGILYRQKRELDTALDYFQQAIMRYVANFKEEDILRNPLRFEGSFITFDLFEVLLSKAECLEAYHQQTRHQVYAQAAVDTYASAFRMADYVSKTFDNEDARLFLSEKALPAYQQAVSLLIRLYRQEGKQAFLEKALAWSEKSKARSLAVSLKESRVKAYSGLPDSLLSQENRLRSHLSRLLMKISQAQRQEETTALQAEIRDQEVALSRLQDRLNDYPEYYRQKYSYDSLDIGLLREQVLDNETALLSYFFSTDGLKLFVLKKNTLQLYEPDCKGECMKTLKQLEASLHSIEAGAVYGGKSASRELYARLIAPALPELKGLSSLIIIPHQQLYRLPFEALRSPEDRYLLYDFALSYQFAASFLRGGSQLSGLTGKLLAVAPFSDKGVQTNGQTFGRLPSSAQEVALWQGETLAGEAATKANFLSEAATASLIHLSTHAVADSENPALSYITFYPEQEHDGGFKLYAHELYGMSLAQTRLTFLSACETSGGKLISSEGIMSLSRAFAYAGCPNLITSLWKAEDHATAYLSQRFYHHLEEGHGFAASLRLAKLDLLENRAYAQFHAPSFWAHLVFIGTPNREKERQAYWWLIPIAGLLLVLGLMYWKRI